MRKKYFNFSNFMDVTLYVFAIVYAFNINITTDYEPNCDDKLVSWSFIYWKVLINCSVLAKAHWIFPSDFVLVEPAHLLPSDATPRDLHHHVPRNFKNRRQVLCYIDHLSRCLCLWIPHHASWWTEGREWRQPRTQPNRRSLRKWLWMVLPEDIRHDDRRVWVWRYRTIW